MKEISDIIKSYDKALLTGQKMALATVVHVDGSSYRRPGARMLVTDDGQLTGAISGGCLEGDALRKALLAISQQKNKLVTYDTTDENDTTLGAQLGCNGIVHILFEPIRPEEPNNPVALLKKVTEKRQNAVLATLFTLYSRTATQPGTCFLSLENETIENHVSEPIYDLLLEKTKDVSTTKDSTFATFEPEGHKLTAFIQYIPSPVSLIIVGAGNDTIPLMEMASVLGWHITVVDGRAGHATRQRFPKADHILVSKATEVLAGLEVDAQTFFVLLTHNYNYDLALLKELIFLDDCSYIGALGPRKKLERMFQDLKHEGIEVTDKQKSKIYGPVGLDIGAETAEEIALSVLAEIKAVLKQRTGTSLRDKIEPIHSRSHEYAKLAKTASENFLCAVQIPES